MYSIDSPLSFAAESTPDAPTCRLLLGDSRLALSQLKDESFHTCVTSPPYWGLRDYGIEGQIGAEPELGEYLEDITGIFREVRRLLRPDGTLWLNIGDSYTSGGRTWRDTDKKNPARAMSYRPPTPVGLKPKDLIGVPWRLAFALQADGWYLRSDIIWHKPNCQPESVKDRPTQSHEYLFLLTKSENYYYDHAAIVEPTQDGKATRNRRTVWPVNTEPYRGAHFAVFPPALIAPCIKAGSPVGGHVLDPFFGTGTVGETSLRLRRNCTGVELNPEYAALAETRLQKLRLPTLAL
ncbi:site-specific DNA-methyltransferase [Hymenobacter weizhouensis]|nr:site-specific DNA-methyltransferase [Hymenobacter sp. YIM 151500-1]UYZ64256.1 site-specific DNA-methyltransferase [Hymenobacter sp. YIM 151500-1]